MPHERSEAFVIFLDPDAGNGEDPVHGHVEHVRSSTRVRFRDREELLAFLAARLAARRRGEGPGGGSDGGSGAADG